MGRGVILGCKKAVGVEITEVDVILAFTSVNQEKNSERRRKNYGSNEGFAGYFRNSQGKSMSRAPDLRSNGGFCRCFGKLRQEPYTI